MFICENKLKYHSLPKVFLTIVLLAVLSGLFGCSNDPNTGLTTQPQNHQMIITTDTLKEVLAAFNRHDLDAIMEYFCRRLLFRFSTRPRTLWTAFHWKGCRTRSSCRSV